MFDKPFDKLNIKDIENLVLIRKEQENNYLEYKERIEPNDKFKKKFLKTTSGFANAKGGYIIIGIKEDKNTNLLEILGIEKTINHQKVEEWVNNILIANLDKKVQYNIKTIEIKDNEEKIVLLIYIPESPKKPHMVTFKGENHYYLRHNKSVNLATQSEVEEMFEYSKKVEKGFEDFLKQRNLFDENSDKFGLNEKSKKLYKEIIKAPNIQSTPFVLYSFMPIYQDEYRVKTASQEFIDWLKKHFRGFKPNINFELFDYSNWKIEYKGIFSPTILNNEIDPEKEKYLKYFEIMNNGFFERGMSEEMIYYKERQDSSIKPILHLTGTVNIALMLLKFAKLFFQKINYYDEILFQLSVVNVKNFTLAGFSHEKNRKSWCEPFSFPDFHPPYCTIDRFKYIKRFIVNELSKDFIENTIYDLAEQLSNAFGLVQVKYFVDENNL